MMELQNSKNINPRGFNSDLLMAQSRAKFSASFQCGLAPQVICRSRKKSWCLKGDLSSSIPYFGRFGSGFLVKQN